MAFDVDTYLSRAGGSLAQFTGTVLRQIEDSDFARKAAFAAAFLDFLKGLKEQGIEPDKAPELVQTFLAFTGTPQTVVGGTLEVAGAIENVKQTGLALDVRFNFEAPNIPVAGGLSAGVDAGFGYTREDRERTSQNFRCQLRWLRGSGGIDFDGETLAKAAERMLSDPSLEIPSITGEDLADPASLLAKAIPVLADALALPSSP